MQPIDRAVRVLVVVDEAVVRTGMARVLAAQGLEAEGQGWKVSRGRDWVYRSVAYLVPDVD